MKKNEYYKNIPKIETKRLILRKMEKSDLNDIYEYASQDEVSKYVSWDTHQSIKTTEEYINYVLDGYAEEKDGPWVIEQKNTNKVIGAIHLIQFDEKHNLCSNDGTGPYNYALRYKQTKMAEMLKRAGAETQKKVFQDIRKAE